MDESLMKIRHNRSKKDFPGLKLEDDEYVEFAFKRARICLLLVWGGVAFGLIVILFAFLLTLINQSMIDEMGRRFLSIILMTLLLTALLIGIIATMIYNGNRLFITNKHVIQMVLTSPVSSSVNIIDLISIEDASFRQDGIMQKLFKYGTFRLATVGDETTYTFKYSDISGEDLKAITKLISIAKKQRRKRED